MNAVRTHIEHFIDSNPLLESTSCTDPVNNLKNPPKQISRNIIKTPLIVLNLTETDRRQTKIRSRSPSPFWIKGETSTYSEVLKTGCILSRNNSRSTTPESKSIDVEGETRMSRKSSFDNLLRTPPLMKARSKSPKDRWQPNDLKKNSNLRVSSLQKSLTSVESAGDGQSKEDEPDRVTRGSSTSRHVKRRSRSRRNRNVTEKNSENKLVGGAISSANTEETTIPPERHTVNTTSSSSAEKPEIIVSNVKIRRNSEDNLQSRIPYEKISGTYNPVTRDGDWKLLTVDDTTQTVPLNAASIIGDFSKSRLSLDGMLNSASCSDSCYDLNERLKGIFGSVDQKHYRHHRVVDRPRSKSDTRDLNELTQIFTSTTTDDNNKYTCRFERSAGSVKNYTNRDSISGRRSFDNIIILSPFGNTQMQRRSDGFTDNENDESVRLPT